MTCAVMGGPCETIISGNTPEELMNNGTKHLKSMNDEEHKAALKSMQNMSDEENKEWNDKFMKLWNETPDM